MKNRSISFWIHESFKTIGMTVGASFVYALFMGYMQNDSLPGLSGVNLFQQLLCKGFPYFALMQFVFLARYSLLVGQEYIPLCLSFGETRKNVFLDTVVSMVMQFVISTAILCIIFFIAASGSTSESRLFLAANHPGWAVCGFGVVLLLPMAISLLASNICLLTSGRSMNWLPFVTIFGAMFIAMMLFFVFQFFMDSWSGNWIVILIPLLIDGVCMTVGLIWLKNILKNYQVSL